MPVLGGPGTFEPAPMSWPAGVPCNSRSWRDMRSKAVSGFVSFAGGSVSMRSFVSVLMKKSLPSGVSQRSYWTPFRVTVPRRLFCLAAAGPDSSGKSLLGSRVNVPSGACLYALFPL